MGQTGGGSAHVGPRASAARAHVVVLVACAALIGSLVVVALGTSSGVAAQERSSDEIARELSETDREASELEEKLSGVHSDIDRAEVELADIGARLADARARLTSAEGQVSLAEIALVDAEKEREAAQAALVTATRLMEAAAAELELEESVLTDQLVQTFKYGTVGAQRGAMALEVLRRADDPNAFAVGLKQLRTVVDVQDDTVERVFELRDERAFLAEEAARAQGRATQAAFDAQETLEVLEGLREEAAEIAAEIEADESAQTALLDSLRTSADETEALLERVSSRQAALERDLAAERAREEAARRAAEEAARRESGATGVGGGGRLSTPGASGGTALSGIACPVVGAVAGRDYSNDWGYPRSGGRYHQGNDMFASTGTPVVAIDDAVIVRWNPPSAPTSLGGITVTYRTGDNSEWYNAHLDSVAPGISPGVAVARGQTIGTVGRTGNARTTPPHLHLGRRQGGVWVNPWPTTSPVC